MDSNWGIWEDPQKLRIIGRSLAGSESKCWFSSNTEGEGGQHGTRRLKRTEREVGGITDGGEKMGEQLIVPPTPRPNLGEEYASREEEAWGGNGALLWWKGGI